MSNISSLSSFAILFSHPLAEQQIEAVEKVLSELDTSSIPKLMLWNKVLVLHVIQFEYCFICSEHSTSLILSHLLVDQFVLPPTDHDIFCQILVLNLQPFLFISFPVNVECCWFIVCLLLFNDAYCTRIVNLLLKKILRVTYVLFVLSSLTSVHIEKYYFSCLNQMVQV